MRIQRIKIENFRSIKIADISPSEVNVFVGQNNHGKTNFFEAIDWFYTGTGDPIQIVYLRDPSLDMSVELEFSGIQKGIESVKNEKTRESFRKFADGRDTIRVIRRKADNSKRLLWEEEKGEWSTKNFAGFDRSFNDCIPRLEYVSTATRLGDVSKWGKKTPVGVMLSGVLSAILEKSAKYREFRSIFDELFGSEGSDIKAQLDSLSGKVKLHLEQQFPDCSRVTFEVAEPAFDDLLRNFETSINDGVETRAEEKGDGMQRALMLAIIKTYSDYRRDNEDLGKRFLFLVDEAELHLHPTAQRQLKDALFLLAGNGDQVFINTHSSVLVADDHPRQSLYKVWKKDTVTRIEPIEERDKPQVVFELLGGSPSDLLFPNNFLIVEGRSEFEFLARIIRRFYQEEPRIQIIFASGDTAKIKKSMDAVNAAFTPLYQTPIYRDCLMLLCDKPNDKQKKEYDKFIDSYPSLIRNGQLVVLPTCSIEEYYPLPWRRNQDQVKSMLPREKTDLAARVGEEIGKAMLEKEMPVLLVALSNAWQKAHR
jgi:hypothetical protein